MPYPDNTIEELTARFDLSVLLQQRLRGCLTVEGTQAAVERGALDPTELLTQTVDGVIGVLPFNIMKLIVIDPTQLGALKALVVQFHQEALAWEEIKTLIERLNKMPNNQLGARKRLTNEIMQRLLPLFNFVTSHPLLHDDYQVVSSSLLQHMNALTDMIEVTTSEYFIEKFSKEGKLNIEINFLPKQGGVQEGRKVVIGYTDREDRNRYRITYYVKTHQHSGTSEVSDEKPVDPKELFIYKVLEYAGFGPKTHYFFDSKTQGGLFIATQDLGFTKVSGRNKFFAKYQDLKPQFDSGEVELDAQLAREFASTDILSRIFCLFDVTTNPNNLGRVTVDGLRSKWKILDFRVEDRVSYILRSIFEGFREGNGMYNYVGFLGRVIRDRSEAERMATAAELMAELESGRPRQSGAGSKMPLMLAMNRAFCEIASYIQQNAEPLGLDLGAVLGDLAAADLTDETAILARLDELPRVRAGDFGKYVKDAKTNFAELSAGIIARHAELTDGGGPAEAGPARHT